MEITVAKHAGFCFGVKRAVEQVFSLLDSIDGSTTVYTVGPLIHNQHIISKLEERGVKVIEPDGISRIFENTCESSKSTVVIRTHGVPRQVSEQLEKFASQNKYFTVADLTCPFVKKIHNIVSDHRAENIVIVGNEKHPEVIGICSYGENTVEICENSEEILNLPRYDTAVVAAQTTFDINEWKKCQKNIEKVCTNPIIFDTICNVTEIRQSEADELSKNVNVMLVVGSRGSSNTNKLYATAKRNLEKTFLIEDASELPLNLIKSTDKVGITAGASTPDGIIEEVKNTLWQKKP